MIKNKNIKFNKFNKYKYIFYFFINSIKYICSKLYIIYSIIKNKYCIIKSNDIEYDDIEKNNEDYEIID